MVRTPPTRAWCRRRLGMRILAVTCALTGMIPGSAQDALGASPGTPMIPPPKIVTPNTPVPQLPTIPTPVPGMQQLPRVGGAGGTGGAGGPSPIQATNQPIPGIDIVVLEKPVHKLTTRTNSDGVIMLGVLTTGDFELDLTAESLHAAIGKLGGRQPSGGTGGAGGNGGSQFGAKLPNDGLGGSGGNGGAGGKLAGPPPNGGNDSDGGHGGNGGDNAAPQFILIGLLLPAVQPARDGTAPTTPGTTLTSHGFKLPMPGKGLHIAFRIGGSGSVMKIDWGDGSAPSIFDRWGNRLPENSAPIPKDRALAGPGQTTSGAGPAQSHSRGIVTLVR